jgi:hypothetical protein
MCAKSQPIKYLLFSFLLLGVAGCGKGSPSPSSASTTPATGDGIIQGRVTLAGPQPPQQIISNSPNIPDETIVADTSSGLKNVIVFIQDAPPAPPPSTQPVILDQIGCVYVPHVIAIQTGQTLRIKSSDNLMHNVDIQSSLNPQANFGFPAPGQHDFSFATPEPPFPVKCDVHPWMSAWIGVFNHPWFAVSASDGSFTISHVPPGNYTLIAWQEALPQQQQQITVSNSSPTQVQFNFPAP